MRWGTGARRPTRPAVFCARRWGSQRRRTRKTRFGCCGVARVGNSARSAEIALEDGAVLRVETALPQDLPPGYHKVRYYDREHETQLIVSPGLCYLPEHLRVWGWSTQLYALRSKQSWGIGDFADMRELGRWSAREFQAGVMLINPLGATAPTVPQQPSPYFPSSRIYRNLLYLRIEEIPGAQEFDFGPAAISRRRQGSKRRATDRS